MSNIGSLYRILFISLVFALHSSAVSAQSSIFSENFDSYSNGTTSDAGRWYSTPPGSENYFEVRNNRFEGDNLDGDATWETDTFDIASCDSIRFSLDAIDGGDLESTDYFDVYYSTDGGSSYSRIQNWNSLGDANHTLVGDKPDDSDWGTETISKNGITGSQFILRVVMNTNAEVMALDNVSIDGYSCSSCPHSLSSFSPSEGCPDTGTVTVTINGSGFTSGTGTSDIQFGGVSASSFSVISDSEIEADVPSDALDGSIKVVTDGCGVTSGSSFDVSCTLCHEVYVNEFSNGESGSREYMELIVGNSCGECHVDLNGWIIDDNNGDFSGGPSTGEGIAQGHVRFDPNGDWENIPTGSIILIYNSADENLTIQNEPVNDDPTDSNNDSVYVIPISNSGLQECTSTPNSSDASYSGCSYSSPASWNPISMANSQDASQVRKPDASYFHGASYGSDAAFTGGPDNLHVHNASGSDDCFYFGAPDARDVGNWYQGAATNDLGTTDETPRAANNSSNSTEIQEMRIGCSTLPIELAYFGGEALEKGNRIRWRTLSETQHGHFEIQRSPNASDFHTIKELEGKGQVGSISDYSVMDFEAPELSYYRLKSVDLDGSTEFSRIIAISRDEKGRELRIQRDGSRFTAKLPEAAPKARLQIVDVTGRQVRSFDVSGTSRLSFDLSGEPQGVYLLRYKSRSNGSLIKKFIR